MRKVTAVAAAATLGACAGPSETPLVVQMSAGETAFQMCGSCHALEAGGSTPAGPTLHAIVGRPIAAEPDFDFSPAMRRFAQTHSNWTRELLDRFAADPQALVPGTSMDFHGMPDTVERKALLDYLERLSGPGQGG